MEAFEELRQVYAALDTRDLLEEMRSRGIVRAADGVSGFEGGSWVGGGG